MKKTTVLKLGSGLLCAGSALFFWVYGAYRWTIWRVGHPAPNTASSIGIIGGADGPTAVFIASGSSDSILAAIGGSMEFYLVGGAAMLAGALGLFLWARRISKRGRS